MVESVTTETDASADAAERKALAGVGAIVLALNLGAWGLFGLLTVPGMVAAGSSTSVPLGLAVGAYALGMRHAFDADHLAAIDNATRRLVASGRRPVSVGFWFALGHSTVVFGAVALVLTGFNAFSAGLSDDGSSLRQGASIWGAAFSGGFLLLIGAMNLPSLRGISAALRAGRRDSIDTAVLERHLESRGFLVRALSPLMRLVDAPWKMYPTGFLFGLGLDTAASIGLFVAAALRPGTAPLTAMTLPLLFTAGMTLFDTADGAAMNRIYRWASGSTYRTAAYNLAVTGLSVVISFVVGAMGLASVAVQVLGLHGGPLAALAGLDSGFLGMCLAAVFAAFGLHALRRSRLGSVREPVKSVAD